MKLTQLFLKEELNSARSFVKAAFLIKTNVGAVISKSSVSTMPGGCFMRPDKPDLPRTRTGRVDVG